MSKEAGPHGVDGPSGGGTDEKFVVDFPKAGDSVKENFTVVGRLSNRESGSLFRLENELTGEFYAMKVESLRDKSQILKMEVMVMKDLERARCAHACSIIESGRNAKFSYLIMNLVGANLDTLRRERKEKKFSLRTTIEVGLQALEAIQGLHSVKYIHRDIKPSNFAVGRKDLTEDRYIYMLDFGLCRKYVDESGELRPPRPKTLFRGTVMYASSNSHRGSDNSRRDDLESMMYMLRELYVGRLPWADIRKKEDVALEKKNCRNNGSLYVGIPIPFSFIMHHVESLGFKDEPDYQLIEKAFKLEKKLRKFRDNDMLDWETKDTAAQNLADHDQSFDTSMNIASAMQSNRPKK